MEICRHHDNGGVQGVIYPRILFRLRTTAGVKKRLILGQSPVFLHIRVVKLVESLD